MVYGIVLTLWLILISLVLFFLGVNPILISQWESGTSSSTSSSTHLPHLAVKSERLQGALRLAPWIPVEQKDDGVAYAHLSLLEHLDDSRRK